MRKGLYILTSVVLVFALSGCKKKLSDKIDCSVNHHDSCLVIIEKDTLNTIDISDEYIINSTELKTYTIDENPSSYVDIEEFIQFLEGVIVELEVEKDKQLKLALTIEYEDEFGDEKSYEVTIVFNSEADTIYFSNFYYSEYINLEPRTDFADGLEIIDYISQNKSSEITMELSKYDINIVNQDNRYYIPLYLANLILTGDGASVYEVEDTIYVFDYYSENMFEEDLKKYEKDQFSSELIKNSKNFLALVFDYYYGLKGYKEITSYQDEFDQYKLPEQDSFKDYYEEFADFLFYNDDLHTWIVSTGYNLDIDDFEPDFTRIETTSNFYRNSYSSYVNLACEVDAQEIIYEVFQDTIYIKINAFSMDTGNLLKPIMNIASQYENVVFDLKCNGGGMVAGVIHLLSYMTDDPITTYYKDEFLDIKGSITYDTTEDNFLDKEYYIVTSPSTFSAANLFVSIVKENQLATIIGEDSLGGAFAIKIVVLPDGSIMQMSGSTGFTTKEYETIEYGVKVDHKIKADEYDLNYENKVLYFIETKDTQNLLEQITFDYQKQFTDVIIHPNYPIVYGINGNDNTIYSINYETGTSKTQSFTLKAEAITFYDNKLYVTLLKGEHSSYWWEEDQEGAFAILDANSLEIEAQYDIEIDPYDIAVDGLGFIYISSGSGQSTFIKSYSQNGELVDTSYLRQQSRIVVDPLDEKIYALDTDLSPRDMEAFYTYNGHFKAFKELPYHGDYRLNEDFITVSPDGRYIFNGSGNIFTSSDNREEDLLYFTTLSNQYKGFAFNLPSQMFYALSDSGIDVYDYQTFTKIGTYYLERDADRIFFNNGNILALSNVGLTIIPTTTNQTIFDEFEITEIPIGQFVDDNTTNQSELYRINIDEAGMYLATVSTDDDYQLLIYNDKGTVLNAYRENRYRLNLQPGQYYYQVIPLGAQTFDYQFRVDFINHDDYADYTNDNGNYPIGILSNESNINGILDYYGDIDVFEISGPLLLDLKLISDEDIKLQISYDGKIYYNFTNGTYMTNYFDYSNGHPFKMYLIVSSDTNQIGNYQIEYFYDNIESYIPKNLPNNEEPIIIEDAISGYLWNKEHIEIIKFELANDGLYEFYSSIDINGKIELYDESGKFVATLRDQYSRIHSETLDAGIYYFKIYLTEETLDKTYHISLREVIEQVTGIVNLDLSNMKEAASGVLDYNEDIDLYQMVITETTYLKINVPSFYDIPTRFDILNVSGEFIVQNISSSYQGVFNPGVYTIQVKVDYVRLYDGIGLPYSIDIEDLNQREDDFIAYISSNTEQLGQLYFNGITTVSFDLERDEDMYFFSIVT